MTHKKIGIITFHASHNYGSMLQAYALQQTVLGMGLDCEIINFRTNIQTEHFKPPFMRGTIQGKIKRFIQYLPYCYSLFRKYEFIIRKTKCSGISEQNVPFLKRNVPLNSFFY